MTDQINELLESVKERTDSELHSDLDTVISQVDGLQAENEQLREQKESIQTELKKTTKGTLVLASELEERYQQLFENAIEGIYTTTEDLDEYLLTNPAFVELLGYESEDAVRAAVDSIKEDVFVDPDRYAEYAETLHADGEINQIEYQVRTADGTTRWVSDSVRALIDDDGAVEGYRGAVIDITEQRTKQRELERQTNLGLVLNRVLRHNLRNDLSVVRGYTQLMSNKLDDDTNGERALSAIDGLLRLADKARQLDEIVGNDSEPESTDIPALINGVVTQIRRENPSATISVVSDGDEAITAEVLPSFKRAIEELLENAVKHSGAEPKIDVTIEAESGDVRIRIADNGPGIAEQELSVLESGTETQLSHGSGLGLWLTHWIVTSQGGVIDGTASDAGTTLSVVVPRTTSDGTPRQLVEVAKARDQYKSAFEEAGDGMTITDDKGCILDVNNEAAGIFGVEQSALIGRPIREFMPADFDFEAEWGEVQAAEMKRGVVNVVSADGGVSPIEYTAKSNIVPGQHLIVSRDITERKEREEQLRETSARLETLFEKSPDMIDVLDSEGTLVEVNRRFCEELGYEKQEVIGDPIWEFDRDVTEEDVRALLSNFSVGERRRFESRYERRDGSTFPVEVHLLRFGLEDDDRFLAASRDITERKQRNEEVRRLKQRLELAVEAGGLGIWDWDMTTDDVEFNEQFVQMLGYSPEEFGEGFDAWRKRCHPDDLEQVEAGLEAHINGEVSQFENEHRVKTAEGGWKWVRGIGQIVDRDEEGNPLRGIGIHVDISDSMEREQELALAETVFQASQDALVLVDVVDEQTFRIRRVNEAYRSQSGRSSADVTGKTPRQVLGEAAGGRVESRYRQCVEQREPIQFTEEVPSDGEPKLWETRLTPLIQDDEVTQLVGAAREVTEGTER